MTMITATNEPATVGRRFLVTGMTCGHCEHAIETALAGLAGVCKVDADAVTGIVLVESTGELDTAEVAEAIDEAGYELAR